VATLRQVERIRELSRQGRSANEIQRQLQKEHLGMKRQRLLKYVREFKGRPAPRKPFKYVPIKYRERRRIRIPRKQVAVYGSVNGQSRRVQLYGDGQSLYRAMILVMKRPPRQRFLTIGAGAIVANPPRYLERWRRWDERPKAES